MQMIIFFKIFLMKSLRMMNHQMTAKKDGETHLLDVARIIYIESVEIISIFKISPPFQFYYIICHQFSLKIDGLLHLLFVHITPLKKCWIGDVLSIHLMRCTNRNSGYMN